MARRDVASQHKDLLRELNEERASALMRISRTLEGLIAQLNLMRERNAHLAAGSDGATEISEYREVRQRALRYRWYLEVQREALGLRRHDVLDEFYKIP